MAGDTVEDLQNKVFDTTVGSLLTVKDELDPEVIQRAIETISNARRWSFTGLVHPAQWQRTPSTNFSAAAVNGRYTDPHIQHMSAISLGEGDVTVAISQSGQTQALLESVRLPEKPTPRSLGWHPKTPR